MKYKDIPVLNGVLLNKGTIKEYKNEIDTEFRLSRRKEVFEKVGDTEYLLSLVIDLSLMNLDLIQQLRSSVDTSLIPSADLTFMDDVINKANSKMNPYKLKKTTETVDDIFNKIEELTTIIGTDRL